MAISRSYKYNSITSSPLITGHILFLFRAQHPWTLQQGQTCFILHRKLYAGGGHILVSFK